MTSMVFLAALAAAAPGGVSADGAELEQLAGELTFAEGPATDAAGNVYFTDQPNDRILCWSVEGKLSTFRQPCEHANGLCFDAEGWLWLCADEHNQLQRLDPRTGRVEVLVRDYQGKLLNGPNDVWVAPDGGAWFTDPYFKRPWWQRGGPEQGCEGVYYLAPNHQRLVRVVDDLKKPNGIIGTPDGKTLYVADIGANRTFAYTIEPDGTLSGKRLFCALGSDGMTLDDEGNLYLTGDGVIVFDRDGRQLEHTKVPEKWTGNVCIGGADRRTLFITASKGLYGLRLRTRGVGSQ